MRFALALAVLLAALVSVVLTLRNAILAGRKGGPGRSEPTDSGPEG